MSEVLGRRDRRWMLIVSVSIATVLLIGGCSSSRPEDSTVTSTTSTTADPRPVPAPGGSVAWLELENSEVRSGETIFGVVVVVNDTGSPLKFLCGGSPYAAGVETPFGVESMSRLAVCEAPPASIPVGESRWPIQVPVRYSLCRDEPSPRSPQCAPDHQPPAIQAGPSRVVVDLVQPAPTSAPIPAPVEIVIE